MSFPINKPNSSEVRDLQIPTSRVLLLRHKSLISYNFRVIKEVCLFELKIHSTEDGIANPDQRTPRCGFNL